MSETTERPQPERNPSKCWAARCLAIGMKPPKLSMFRITWLTVLSGLISSAAAFATNDDASPATDRKPPNDVRDDVEKLLYIVLKREGCIRHPKLNYEIYVKRVDGRKLHDVVFLHANLKGKGFDLILRAREAELFVDNKRAQIVFHVRNAHLLAEDDQAYFADRFWCVDLPKELIVSIKKGAK